MGFDKEGASPTKSRSKATATLRKVSNPIFLQMQKNNGKKKKQQRANLFAKLLLAFCGDYSRFLEKRQKNGISNGIRTHVAGMRTRCPRPLDDGDTLCDKIYCRSWYLSSGYKKTCMEYFVIYHIFLAICFKI